MQGFVENKGDKGDFIMLFDLPDSVRDWDEFECTGRDYWNFKELGRMETLRETVLAFVELAESRGVTIHGKRSYSYLFRGRSCNTQIFKSPSLLWKTYELSRDQRCPRREMQAG